MTNKSYIKPVVFMLCLSWIATQSRLAFSSVGDTSSENMGHLSSAIMTAAVTAAIGGLGWIVAYIMNSRRDDRTKRLQLTIEHTSTQIREFYAPLVALTDQLNTMSIVKAEIVKNKSHEFGYDISRMFHDMFFLPIHEEIVEVLKTKVHLIEGSSTPLSFEHYFQHYAAENAYWRLLSAGRQVNDMQVPSFPENFYYDVRRDYKVVLKRHEACLEELRS